MDRITGPARAAMEELRSTYRRSAGYSITISGHSTDAGGMLRPIRSSLLIAASGDLKLLSPAYNLTHLRGTVYVDSAYFPGYIVKSRVLRAPDATMKALETVWPLDPLPIEIRLRLAAGIESAFAPMLDAIGAEGVVTLSAGVWPDGSPAQALRFRGGETDLVVWIDPGSGLVRGIRGRVSRNGGIIDLDEARDAIAVDRSPQIVVATANRIPVPTFAALRKAWDAVHTAPPPPGG